MPPEPQEEQVLDVKDPRKWMADTEFTDVMRDIEVVDMVLELLNGKIAQDVVGPAYGRARDFLRQSGAQLREHLSLMLLEMCGIRLEGEDEASPFRGAGKPRAFGADPSPPASTLSAACPVRALHAPGRYGGRELVYGHRLGIRAHVRCRAVRR